jgi:hypothetical protein
MHSDGGGRRGAAVLLLYTLTFGLSAAVCATAEEPDASDSAERFVIDPARLGAVPAESRALFVEVLDRLETMRGEMDGLRADKAALAERVTRLEEKDCDETRAEEKQEEQEEDDDDEGARDQLTQKTTVMDATNSTRRRAQVGQACERVRDFQALTVAAMDACCPMSGGGHRRMQASCDLPVACPSAACAAVFVPYMTDCAAMVAATPGVPVVDFQSLASSCVEMQAGAGQMMQPVAVQMFRVMVNTEGAAQTGAMFPGGDENGGAGQPLDPLQPLSPAPPPSPDVTEGGDKTAVQQYHAVCTTADVASCVPACNAEHHGYELLATIDGTDTKYSCNLAHGLYSWMGAASEGGYLGADSASFLSAVLSGAAGAFVLTLTEDIQTGLHLQVQPEQDVHISGDPGLPVAPSWGGTFMATVHVRENAKATLTFVFFTDKITVEARGVLSARLCIFGKGGVGFNGVGLQLEGGQASLSDCSFGTSGTTYPSMSGDDTLAMSNTPLHSIALTNLFQNMGYIDHGVTVHFANVAVVDCLACEPLTGTVQGAFATRVIDGSGGPRDWSVEPPALAAAASCCGHHSLAAGGWCGGAQSNTWCFPQHVVEVRCNDDC